jgi:hypothetical protein
VVLYGLGDAAPIFMAGKIVGATGWFRIRREFAAVSRDADYN